MRSGSSTGTMLLSLIVRKLRSGRLEGRGARRGVAEVKCDDPPAREERETIVNPLPGSTSRLPFVGRQANLLWPYLRTSDFPRGRRSDDQGSNYCCRNAGVCARERGCAGARGRCGARRRLRRGRAGPSRCGCRSLDRLHCWTVNRSVLGYERFSLGRTSAAAAPRGRDQKPDAHPRGDGSQRSDASCRQSGSASSGRSRRSGASLGAAGSGVRLRPQLQADAFGRSPRLPRAGRGSSSRREDAACRSSGRRAAACRNWDCWRMPRSLFPPRCVRPRSVRTPR
ncbi:hypothetical protein GA0061098_1011223 [Bradyrhizobium shewense]|uniref:Uncharacterized protein n=1 Tax=Bradyrhizobium shewense TaxID=1761772 RepID=A0A1C3X2G3_9BRAD|nr:hypothetical protein GA0061098_1011223 [Bradyrhizobium shewense]